MRYILAGMSCIHQAAADRQLLRMVTVCTASLRFIGVAVKMKGLS